MIQPQDLRQGKEPAPISSPHSVITWGQDFHFLPTFHFGIMTPPAPLNSLSDKILSDKGEMDIFEVAHSVLSSPTTESRFSTYDLVSYSLSRNPPKNPVDEKSPRSGEHQWSAAGKLRVARWESRKLRLMAQSLIYGPDTFGAALHSGGGG